MDKFILQNKTILVTGAGDGIGYRAACHYAQHGATVIAIGRTDDKLKKLATEIKQQAVGQVFTYRFDLMSANERDYQQLAENISQQHHQLDGLLNNAGLLGHPAPIIDYLVEDWLAVMQVNVNAGFILTKVMLPLLLKSPIASLIFTSSSVGHKGSKNWGAYSVSKFATEGLMQVLADEYHGSSLRVNCIDPGRTRTKMRASAAPDEDPLTIPSAQDIMPLYLYLMSDESAQINGQSLNVKDWM